MSNLEASSKGLFRLASDLSGLLALTWAGLALGGAVSWSPMFFLLVFLWMAGRGLLFWILVALGLTFQD